MIYHKGKIGLNNSLSLITLAKGGVKIYRVPGPGLSTGGEYFFFEKKGALTFF